MSSLSWYKQTIQTIFWQLADVKFATEVTFTRKANCLTLKLNNGRQPRPSSTGTFSLRRQSSGPMVSTFSADKLVSASGTRVTRSIDLEIEHGLKWANSKRPDLAMESLQLKKVFTFSVVTAPNASWRPRTPSPSRASFASPVWTTRGRVSAQKERSNWTGSSITQKFSLCPQTRVMRKRSVAAFATLLSHTQVMMQSIAYSFTNVA